MVGWKIITYYFAKYVFILLQFNMRNGRVVPVSGGVVMEGQINGNLTRTYSLPFLPDLKLRSTENRSHGTTRNKVIRLGWSRIGLAVLILHAVGVGLTGRPAFISGRYNRFNSLQLQNHCATHTFRHFNTHFMHNYAELVMGNDHRFLGIMLAVAGGILCDRVERPISHSGYGL